MSKGFAGLNQLMARIAGGQRRSLILLPTATAIIRDAALRKFGLHYEEQAPHPSRILRERQYRDR